MFGNALKRFYDNFLSLKGSPHHIAFSYAVGTAIGFSPFVGTHSIMSVTISLAFRLNLGAVYLATWLPCNPLTAVPLLVAEYKIGRILLRHPPILLPDVWTLGAMLSMGKSFFASVTLGWIVCSALAAPLAYPVIRAAVVRVRKNRIRPDHEKQDV